MLNSFLSDDERKKYQPTLNVFLRLPNTNNLKIGDSVSIVLEDGFSVKYEIKKLKIEHIDSASLVADIFAEVIVKGEK